MTNERQGGNGPFFLGLLLGALVGGIVAGLAAPRSGEQTRAKVRERGLELKDRAEDMVLRAQNAANETLSRVQQSAQGVVGGRNGKSADLSGPGSVAL